MVQPVKKNKIREGNIHQLKYQFQVQHVKLEEQLSTVKIDFVARNMETSKNLLSMITFEPNYVQASNKIVFNRTKHQCLVLTNPSYPNLKLELKTPKPM